MLRTALFAACFAATASVSRANTCADEGVTSSSQCVSRCALDFYPSSQWISSNAGGGLTQSCHCNPAGANLEICSTYVPASASSSTTMAAAAAVGALIAYVL